MVEELIRLLQLLHFSSPIYFFIALILMAIAIFAPKRREIRGLKMNIGYFSKRTKLKTGRRFTIPALIIMTTLLLAVAFAGPSLVSSRMHSTSYSKPMMVIIDVSGSMTAGGGYYGMPESGFRTCRTIFYDLIERDLDASIGLMVYSVESYILRDFTDNKELLRGTLDNDLEINDISTATETTKALAKARHYFDKVQSKEKVILIMTDFMDDLDKIAMEMRRSITAGIKVYGLVILGSAGEAQKITIHLTNLAGSVWNPKGLEMAWMSDKTAVESIYQEISSIKGDWTHEGRVTAKESLLPYILPAIFALVVLCVVLSETLFRRIPQ